MRYSAVECGIKGEGTEFKHDETSTQWFAFHGQLGAIARVTSECSAPLFAKHYASKAKEVVH